MPGCDQVCWYVIESPYPITTAQRDFFVYDSNDSNARRTGLGSSDYTAMFFWYGKDAPEPTPQHQGFKPSIAQKLADFLN